jgi:dCTP deaminase
MSNIEDQVHQDAASLHRFVCSISDKCERLSAAVGYPASSERFFRYICELATATKAYLQKSLDVSGKTSKEYLDLRGEIATLRSSWSFMHQFVKPVLDADTLRLPTSVLDGLKARFRQISGHEDTDFVFYHTSHLNYFNIKLEQFKPRARQISNSVGGLPKFPEHLGLIGIPYSQSSSVFVNCLIGHEMGHYLFGESQLAGKFRVQIESRLSSLHSNLSTDDRTYLTSSILMWFEELFCDVFAVRLVGFCFSLAFVELYDCATILDENCRCQGFRGDRVFLHHQHPPDLFRLKLQVSALKSDGWWVPLTEGRDVELRPADSHYVKTLEAADGLKDGDFFFNGYRASSPSVRVDVKKLFFEILPSVVTELDVLTATIRDGASQWGDHGELIERYLEHGTVPSTLIPSAGSKPQHPKPVALLNASYRFYIQSLSKLTSKIEGAKQRQIEVSSFWARKVESWTAKAIEDVALLEGKSPSLTRISTKGRAEMVRTSGAVLSVTEIKERLAFPAWNHDSLIITPLLDRESFDQDSIDLRLGTHFLMPQVPPEPYVDMGGGERSNQTYLQLHAPLGSYFVLPAHQTVLGATLEFVKLPYDISGEILTKSSIARTFITIETAPWIHPSYRGCLTLEIANVSSTAIILYPGMPIGQLVLFHTGVKKAPLKLSGSYLGPIYPEAPNMRMPREMMKKLGLSKYRRPGHGWVDDGKIRKEIGQAMGKMNSPQRAKVRTIIRILSEAGGLTSDHGIGDVLSRIKAKGTRKTPAR